jgi:hypothetical protein
VDPTSPPVLDAADLARRLRETEAELARVTLRLRRLEDSAAVQLAQLFAAAARDPRRRLPGLPRAAAGILRRRWRRKGRQTSSPPPPRPSHRATRATGTSAGGTPSAPTGERLADRLLAASAVLVTTRDRPVLAVVTDVASARAWSEDAHVQLLRPDDALAVLAAATPDVLVVDAAAGRAGPWTGLGTYDVPERDRTLLELLRAARDRDIPTVLVPADASEEAPMLADARRLFSGHAGPGSAVADLVAAGRGAA